MYLMVPGTNHSAHAAMHATLVGTGIRLLLPAYMASLAKSGWLLCDTRCRDLLMTLKLKICLEIA